MHANWSALNNTSDETENGQNKMNIDPEPVETAKPDDSVAESVEMDTKEKIIGTFVTKTVGIWKHKKACKAKCRICGKSCDSMKELNQHHRRDHDIQFCSDYGKGFNMQTSLDKHWYVHKELRFVCEVCGQGFPFDSRLEQHKVTHRNIATLPCMHRGYGKSFKNLGDLNRHVN